MAWLNENERIYGLEEKWVHVHRCLMDLEHGFVGLGSAHKTCRHKQMGDWTVQGRRIWCGASGCMIHYHKLESIHFIMPSTVYLPLDHQVTAVVQRVANASGPIARVAISVGDRGCKVRIRHGSRGGIVIPGVQVQFRSEARRW